jgi:hypothetical protein
MWGDKPNKPIKQHGVQQRAKEERVVLDKKEHVRRARLRALVNTPLLLPASPLSVRELASKLGMLKDRVLRRLVALGEPSSIQYDHLVDLDTAELLGLEMGRKVMREAPGEDLLNIQYKYVILQLQLQVQVQADGRKGRRRGVGC